MTTIIGKLIDEWRALRAELAEIEAAEHPDITDSYGRVWVWKPGGGDLYSHDNALCIPKDWVNDEKSGLPSYSLVDNPNYNLCEICRQNWPTDYKGVIVDRTGITTEIWLDVVEELVMKRKALSWRYVPNHPWGDIIVYLKVGNGWSMNPNYQNFDERLSALKRAHAEYHETITTHT